MVGGKGILSLLIMLAVALAGFTMRRLLKHFASDLAARLFSHESVPEVLIGNGHCLSMCRAWR